MGLARVEWEYVVAESGTFADEMLLLVEAVLERRRNELGAKWRLSGKCFRWPKAVERLWLSMLDCGAVKGLSLSESLDRESRRKCMGI